jgi:hypothetical protein
MAVFAGAGVGWFIGRSGPSEKVKAARKEQGTLIASGLMAGAAIMGTLGSVLLLKDMWLWVYERLGLGLQYPPMEYVDVVKMSAEKGTGAFAHYYESIWGQLVSVFIGVAGLIACCWHLARKGARMQLEEEEAADQ